MNVTAVVLLLICIAIALWGSEYLASTKRLPVALARKIVHIVAVTAVAISPAFFYNQLLLGSIVAGFTAVLFWAVATNKLAIDESRSRKSWGIVLFPIAFLLLLAFFGKSKPWLVIYPMLVLAWADAAAAIAGETWAKKYFNLTGDRKSFIGSGVFIITTVSLLWWVPNLLAQIHPVFHWPQVEKQSMVWAGLLLFVALLAAMAEVLGSGGLDNVLVPVFVAWGMEALVPTDAWLNAGAAIPLATIFGVLAFQKKWLDAGGAVAAALLGVVVWMAGGWLTAIPILLFFVTGSLLGKLPRRAIADAKHNQPRDWVQVAANGGMGGAILVANTFFPGETLEIAFLISVAVCTADTWSSEIGQWAGGKVVDIMSFKPLQPGLSGGISWQGCVAGLLGASMIGMAGFVIANISAYQALLIAGVGFAGMLLDSMLGSKFQARYMLSNGQLTEDAAHAPVALAQKGWVWMTNDMVNWLSNVLVIAVYLICRG